MPEPTLQTELVDFSGDVLVITDKGRLSSEGFNLARMHPDTAVYLISRILDHTDIPLEQIIIKHHTVSRERDRDREYVRELEHQARERRDTEPKQMILPAVEDPKQGEDFPTVCIETTQDGVLLVSVQARWANQGAKNVAEKLAAHEMSKFVGRGRTDENISRMIALGTEALRDAQSVRRLFHTGYGWECMP